MKVEDYRVTVQARPEPLGIDPSKTAVLVVDMQNDFGATGGMFDRAGVDFRMYDPASRRTYREGAARSARCAHSCHLHQDGAPAGSIGHRTDRWRVLGQEPHFLHRHRRCCAGWKRKPDFGQGHLEHRDPQGSRT